MQRVFDISDEVWNELDKALQKIQTQVPGERPGEIIIRPMFADPGEWLAAIIEQNIQQHVPIIPSGEAARMIAEAEALKRNAETLIRAQRGIAVQTRIADDERNVGV